MTSSTLPRRPPRRARHGRPIHLVCSGCGHRQPDDQPLAFACPMARPGDDVDHVLSRVVEPATLHFPVDDDPNPFVRYRRLLTGYHVARASGREDEEIVATIEALDRNVAEVDGAGFTVTPFARGPRLSRRLGFVASGGLWVKDETRNVSGSHKGRHLFGALLALELAGEPRRSAPLAIASCGNAALAAAVVARAGGRELVVFIPPEAPASVVARLRELGARVEVCERRPGLTGDPTYLRLLEAIADGAIPFTCQGNLNGLAIEGGMTLGWEIVSALVEEHRRLDHVVVQVGGGALASAVAQAFEEARQLGVLQSLPRFHTVQTVAAHPLQRAYARIASDRGAQLPAPAVDEAIGRAARRRSAHMWAWETAPHSVASGILDDETYDWVAVTRAMLRTGGIPVVVDEATLRVANRMARRLTEIDVDHTGSAGLAGVVELLRKGVIGPSESVAVIFTGVRRDSPANGGHP